jgi:hypothetical protein
MKSAKSTGRVVGLALLVQVVVAPPLYFRILPALTAPGTLETAAASTFRIRLALLILPVLAPMSFVVSIAMLPILRRRSERLAFALLALSSVGLATIAAETVAGRNLLAVSLEYAKPGAPAELLRTFDALARSGWRTAHLTNLLLAHASVLFFWFILYRFALINRGLAAFGVAAGLLSTATVLLALLGWPFQSWLMMPVALADLSLIAWLLTRGLDVGQSATPERPAAASA